jgi:biopolymer transport protein ExbD
MKHSRRALRKIRRAKKMAAVTSINLVSMIDIFTILIIYLLVNTAAVQIVGAEQVDLPQSLAQDPPRETVAVIITAEDILVDGKPVLKVADVRTEGPAVLPLLRQRLLEEAPLTPAQSRDPAQEGGEVNILGDKAIPYSLLKKVMSTCADARFARISLGVVPIKGAPGA